MKKTYLLPLVLLWAVLTAFAWFGPRRDVSDAERRPLAQKPALSVETLMNGKFMGDFEKFSLDQFPLRDSFRQMKAIFHLYGLGQGDNNGLYLSRGRLVKAEYPLNKESLNHALERFNYLHDRYFRDSRVYAAVVPDKGYYLAQKAGRPVMDYEALYEAAAAGMPWAEQVDLRPLLTGEDYYATDTHWRQENLLPVAKALGEAMGIRLPESYDKTLLKEDFYGVYYGQAALPVKPDALWVLENELLDSVTVYDYETGKTGGLYDLEKLSGKDPYEVFLSGPRSLLTIENPNAETDRELILFRDSFGSSLAPLLASGYAKITLVDIRYIQSAALGYYVDFEGKDVLFLYSTLVLNNSNTMK